MARKERYLVGLDVGTSKIAAIVGEMTDDGGLDIIGLGLADSKGIRRGVVVNLEAAVESIKKAIEEAELMAGVEIDSVHLALSVYVFGLVRPRRTLKVFHIYFGYALGLVIWASQTNLRNEPLHTYLTIAMFAGIVVHVVLATRYAARRRAA